MNPDNPTLNPRLRDILAEQRDFSLSTFGPGKRQAGVVAHIRKELVEVETADDPLSEWVDVMILAFDGALRSGASPNEVVSALQAKIDKNRRREWPDWRTMPDDSPIEHIRGTHD